MKRPVALVTGGSRGIGYGCAVCLAKDGYDLVIAGRRPESDCTDNLNGLRDLGATVLYKICDVADRSHREAMINDTLEKFNTINVLVNNAGVAPKERRDVLETTEESFDYIIETNLKGPYFLTQSIANLMIGFKKKDANYRGCIINISSVSAIVASVNRGEYCISKAGVSMATKLWATRLGEYDLPVYEIQPGVIKTDMTAGVTAKYDKLISEGLMLQPRWGLPEDVGRAVAMMARGDIGFSTGQVVMVDGGQTVHRF